jgi:hypothetical protein
LFGLIALTPTDSSQKALNIFNAALVTPTYYVYFTSTTIITSAILFKGFKGTPEQIVTVFLGFLTICAGVVLLQLSKAAKDVPDAAVFTGDLDQIHTIAEQEQPETEPKADAIRGAAAIVRRFSHARMRMEAEELRRLHEEKMLDQMQPINEDGQQVAPEYEWDGLRRRRTTISRRPITADTSIASSTPHPPRSPAHPPLGMSRFPDVEDEDDHSHAHNDHDDRSTIFSSIAGSLMRGRGRARTTNTLPTYDEEEYRPSTDQGDRQMSVPLNNVSFNSQSEKALEPPRTVYQPGFYAQDTAYRGAGASSSRANNSGTSLKPPTPPPHGVAKRQFSFNRVFRKSESPTEEERVGLVEDRGDTTRMSVDQGPGTERTDDAFM